MKPLHITATEFTPEIVFDVTKHYFEISGFSRPEDVRTFYHQFFSWVDTNSSEISKLSKSNILSIRFKLIYFNSASSKCLLDILIVLKNLYYNNIAVEWQYEEGDEDLLEAGEEFSHAVEIPFTYTEIEEN